MSLVMANCQFQVCCPRGNKLSPPPFVVLRNNKGNVIAFVVIYYDNFLVVAINGTIRDRVVALIEKNAKKCGVVFKKKTMADPAFQNWDTPNNSSKGEYLGIGVEITGTTMKIAHTDSNIMSWSMDGDLSAKSSNRDIAQVIGRIIWDACLRLQPFGKIAEIIDCLMAVSSTEEDDAAWWDKTSLLSADQLSKINAKRSEVLKNTVTVLTMCPKMDNTTVLVAADASDWGMGGALLNDSNLEESRSIRRKWSAEEKALPIHHREIRAAIETIKWVHSIFPGSKTIILAEDNAVARVALSKSYMCDVKICKELTQFFEWRCDQQINLIVVQVTSANQAADEDSRNLPLNHERCARCIECLLQTPIAMSVLGRKRCRDRADA